MYRLVIYKDHDPICIVSEYETIGEAIEAKYGIWVCIEEDDEEDEDDE